MAMSIPVKLPYCTNCLKSVSERIKPVRKTSLAYNNHDEHHHCKGLVRIKKHYHHSAMWIRRVFVGVDHFSRIGLEKNLATGCATCIDIDNRADAIIPYDLVIFSMNERMLCTYTYVSLISCIVINA